MMYREQSDCRGVKEGLVKAYLVYSLRHDGVNFFSLTPEACVFLMFTLFLLGKKIFHGFS